MFFLSPRLTIFVAAATFLVMNDGAFEVLVECNGGCSRLGSGDRCAECEEFLATRCICCGGDAATKSATGGVFYPDRCPECAAEYLAAACELCQGQPGECPSSCSSYKAAIDIGDNAGECAREGY